MAYKTDKRKKPKKETSIENSGAAKYNYLYKNIVYKIFKFICKNPLIFFLQYF